MVKASEAAKEAATNLLVLLALAWALGIPAGFIFWTSEEAPLRAILSVLLPGYGLASTLWCLLLS